MHSFSDSYNFIWLVSFDSVQICVQLSILPPSIELWETPIPFLMNSHDYSWSWQFVATYWLHVDNYESWTRRDVNDMFEGTIPSFA
jgi:hypothetical protein